MIHIKSISILPQRISLLYDYDRHVFICLVIQLLYLQLGDLLRRDKNVKLNLHL